jgi:hypothetical protein
MSKAGYSAPAAAVVALSAGVAKSVIGVLAPAQFGVDLTKLRLGFDGVTASAVPVQVEICQSTFATNAPGTASTSITPVQVYGRAITAGFTAASNWTTEPTVLTVADAFSVTPNGGTLVYDFPFPGTLDSAVSVGFVIRLNAPAAVNVRPTIYFERC